MGREGGLKKHDNDTSILIRSCAEADKGHIDGLSTLQYENLVAAFGACCIKHFKRGESWNLFSTGIVGFRSFKSVRLPYFAVDDTFAVEHNLATPSNLGHAKPPASGVTTTILRPSNVSIATEGGLTIHDVTHGLSQLRNKVSIRLRSELFSSFMFSASM